MCLPEGKVMVVVGMSFPPVGLATGNWQLAKQVAAPFPQWLSQVGGAGGLSCYGSTALWTLTPRQTSHTEHTPIPKDHLTLPVFALQNQY